MGDTDSDTVNIDQFILDEWDLFCQNKETIVLSVSQMHWNFPFMSKIAMFNIVKFKGKSGPKGKDNVLRPEWLSMFPILQTVRIKTGLSGDRGGDEYRFKLESLLE